MEGHNQETLHGGLAQILTRAERLVQSGQKTVQRTNQRVRESLFTLQFAKEIRAASAFTASRERLSIGAQRTKD
jgi:hypothetical protein